MREATLRLALPWNITSYFPLNSFHPLYASLFDDPESHNVDLRVIDEIALLRKLTSPACASRLSLARRLFAQDIEDDSVFSSEIGSAYLQQHGADQLWLADRLQGDIELHHTAPVTAARRPFAIHCESAHPIFYPFGGSSTGLKQKGDSVRQFYRALFSSTHCLGIFSHLQSTLDDIAAFLQSKEVERKLFVTGTALPRTTTRRLLRKRQNVDPKPSLLFTHSAQQNPASFVLRGGIIALLLAQRLWHHGVPARFVFRCNRPDGDSIRRYGIDADVLERREQSGDLQWITGYMPEAPMLDLFREADFFLLPSVNLHSASLMQAQLAGAIPIVSDTIGVDRFVQDNETGVVLSGVSKNVVVECAETGMPYTDHRRWFDLNFDAMAAQAEDRMMPLLTDRPGRYDWQQRLSRLAASSYASATFGDEIFSILRRQLANQVRQPTKFACAHDHPSDNPVPSLNAREVRRLGLFESPITPQTLDGCGNSGEELFICKGIQYRFRAGATSLSGLSRFSTLDLSAAGTSSGLLDIGYVRSPLFRLKQWRLSLLRRLKN